MEPEEMKRKEAIMRYINKERPVDIYRDLEKNKRWFYFWLNKYKSGEDDWFKDKPKKNKVVHNKISSEIEDIICELRRKLMKTKYSQIGALKIQWELKKLGIDDIPPIWTINRIIKRNKLIKGANKYIKKSKEYPSVDITRINELHQLDLVGPRYIGKGRNNKIYSFNIIDAFSNHVYIMPYNGKRDEYAIEVLISAWKEIGIPKYLQVDNELSFKGSNRHPRSFGKVIRLCLYLGVEIIFIPESEPWRQGIIERFNNVYDKTFFREQKFKDLQHLKDESIIFSNFHNQNHSYSKLKGRTPSKVHTCRKKDKLKKNFKIKHEIPFREGKIAFVRLSDSKGCIRFFSESFMIDKSLPNVYMKGEICTNKQILNIYHDGILIKSLDYKINKR